jgi:integrase/recombinase XerD
LKIERVYQKNRIELYFDVERLLLFLNENEIIISPLKNWKETLQQFIYSVAKGSMPDLKLELFQDSKFLAT